MKVLRTHNASLPPCTRSILVLRAPRFGQMGDLSRIAAPGMADPQARSPMPLFRQVPPVERNFGTPVIVRTNTGLGVWRAIRAAVATIADIYCFEAEMGSGFDTEEQHQKETAR